MYGNKHVNDPIERIFNGIAVESVCHFQFASEWIFGNAKAQAASWRASSEQTLQANIGPGM